MNDTRKADLDPDLVILGETSKTAGNASYGYTCIDKSRHNNVRSCGQDEIAKHVMDPFFQNLEET